MKFKGPSSLRRRAESLYRNAEIIAEHRWAIGAVFLIELVGCTIVPLPNALIMVALVTAAPRRWMEFATGATLGSITGGIALYFVGRLFFESLGSKLISFYGSESSWAEITGWFNSEWGIIFIFAANVTTGFFRVASLAAGFSAMNPGLFIFVMGASRHASMVRRVRGYQVRPPECALVAEALFQVCGGRGGRHRRRDYSDFYAHRLKQRA